MPYLVDGHNLIPHVPGLSLSAMDDELDLIELLQEFCRYKRKTAEVYFDRAPHGFPLQRSFGLVKAFFVPQGITADEAIRRRLKALGKDARNWTVVSSDHQVQAEARSARAQVVDSGEFARQMAAISPGEERNGHSRKESADGDLKEWLDLFGTDKSDK